MDRVNKKIFSITAIVFICMTGSAWAKEISDTDSTTTVATEPQTESIVQEEIDTWEEDFTHKLDKALKNHKKYIKKIEKKIKSKNLQKVQKKDVPEDNEETDWVKDVQKQTNAWKINELKNTIKDDEKQLKKWKREAKSIQRKIKKALNRQKKFSATLNGMTEPTRGILDGNWFYYFEVKSSLDQSRAECVRLEQELENNFEEQQSTIEKLEDDKQELKDCEVS